MRTMLIASALAAVLAGPALAQNAAAEQINAERIHEAPSLITTRDPSVTASVAPGAPDGAELDRLIGQRVTDSQGKELGDVENVLVRPDGQVAGLVVEWGELAALRGNQVAVDWDDVAVDGDHITLKTSRDELEKSPTYDPDVPAAGGVDPDVKPLR